MKLRYIGFLLIAAAGPLVAHDFWLQPQRFQVDLGVSLPVTFQVGHGANRQRWGNGSDRIIMISNIFKGKRVDQRSRLRDDGPADLVTSFAAPGLHLLTMQTTYSYSDLPAIRFNDFAKEEGLAPAIAERKRTRTSDKPGRERYSRRAKALIQVGSQAGTDQSLATRAIGLKLEIVPERNPYALGTSRSLPVHVIYRGRRLANATVKFTNLAFDAKPLAVVVTDKAGRATFNVPAAGEYLLNVIWTEPVTGDPKAEFDTTFSSLTFGYGARRASR